MTPKDWQVMLADVARAGVYRADLDNTQPLDAVAAHNGQLIFRVSLSRAADRDDALQVIGRVLAFPEWFGVNLDALHDCLVDMGWRPAQGYIILLEHCENLLLNDEAGFGMLLKVFADAAEEWRSQGICFWCLADAGPASIPFLLASE